MHELSIARSVLDLIAQHVPAEQHVLVRTVRLRVGALAGVVGDSLEFCFEALVHDTPLTQARLEIVNVPVTVHCSACQRAFAIELPSFICPRCGGTALRVCSGEELHLDEIDLAEGMDDGHTSRGTEARSADPYDKHASHREESVEST